jgi:hypothetical protein
LIKIFRFFQKLQKLQILGNLAILGSGFGGLFRAELRPSIRFNPHHTGSAGMADPIKVSTTEIT